MTDLEQDSRLDRVREQLLADVPYVQAAYVYGVRRAAIRADFEPRRAALVEMYLREPLRSSS